MKIAFYAPLKSPWHSVPSGDRLMARLLMEAMGRGGHEVTVASELRSFSRTPDDPAAASIQAEALCEIDRLSLFWEKDGPPDLWFAYHPYYKSPDLIGPALCRRFAIAYVTAEASYSRRRDIGQWAGAQVKVLDAIRLAAVNLCMTARDRAGLEDAAPDARLAPLPPFIDTALFSVREPSPQPRQLIAVAMMRAGDKMDSFTMLAKALEKLTDEDWVLTIVGDGPMRGDVVTLYSCFGARVRFVGQQAPDEVAALLSENAIYVWPGCGEAYGLAYLEAQAAGLPVVAQRTGGVPEVVRDGVTGLLTADGDIGAYADAIRQLLQDDKLRKTMAGAARHFVLEERSIDTASVRLDAHLRQAAGR